MLDKLPAEILDRILVECDPIDIASFSQIGRFAKEHVYGDQNQIHLWHLIFLHHFDPPICSNHHQPVMGRGGEIEGEEDIVKSKPSELNLPTIIDWRESVQRRIKLRQTLSSTDDNQLLERLVKNYPDSQLLQVYQDLFEILNTSKRDPIRLISTGSVRTDSLNLNFLQNLLIRAPSQFRIIHYSGQNSQNQPLFALRATLHNPLVSAAAELHTKYGLTAFDQSRPRTRGIARESCYALANYHPGNFYGPFMPDRSCRVNWAHLEALSVVVGLNLSLASQSRTEGGGNDDRSEIENRMAGIPPDLSLGPNPIPEAVIDTSLPTSQMINNEIESTTTRRGRSLFDIKWPILEGLSAARPFSQIMHPAYQHMAYSWPPVDLKVDRPIDFNHYDWAGVEGKWLRVVCFLDYRDLHAYNFYPANPRPKLDDYNEAIRLMTLDLKVISIGDRPGCDPGHPKPPSLQTGPQDRPPIYFRGTSAAKSSVIVGHPTAQVRGCVSSTKDGEVRWSVVSTAAGEDRWSSEGIQVGGVRSRWGVLGVWTDVDRTDVEGPAGPFYFFKTSY